jgi:tRNA threonylcarbamoyladenosine biosynthesis protein TsaB
MPVADPHLILALDATSARCSAVLWREGALLAGEARSGPTGEAALLPRMVADLLASQDIAAGALTAIAVAVGPGSFTGLRASLALAQGLATGANVPVIAVTVAEALAVAIGERADGRPIWCALDARQGRLFLQRSHLPEVWEVAMLAHPPIPVGPVLLTGDAAEALALSLKAAGVDAMASAARQTHARDVAVAAILRMRGLLPPLEVEPLYIDPPRAQLPRGGLRPPPQEPVDPP